jgi:AAA+ ATPase superfamily predicted ATPase
MSRGKDREKSLRHENNFSERRDIWRRLEEKVKGKKNRECPPVVSLLSKRLEFVEGLERQKNIQQGE